MNEERRRISWSPQSHRTGKCISLRHVGETDGERKEKRKRGAVMRLDPDPGNDWRGKRMRRFQILLMAEGLERIATHDVV